ncbi:thioredoxin domain-containing protein [Roseivirga echinicomitans]
MKGLLIALMLTIGIGSAYGQFIEKVHYTKVSETKSPTPVVTEFFSMFCGQCFEFESMLPELTAGMKAGTKFEKSHVDYIPRDTPEVQAGIVQSFVIMDQMGAKGAEVLAYFFDQIHIKGRAVDGISTMKLMFQEKGVSKAEVDKYFADKTLNANAKKMARIWETKQVTSVPSLVVNGKYLINMGSVKSMNELVSLTNYLIGKN